jgi:hypothetical protein
MSFKLTEDFKILQQLKRQSISETVKVYFFSLFCKR